VACLIQVTEIDNATYFHIQIYFFASDQGGDQKGCDTQLDIDFAYQLLVWKFRQWCVLHTCNLMTSKQLRRTSGGKHFAKVAKTINVIRFTGNLQRIYSSFSVLFGKSWADRALRKFPPRPLRIRWGSLTNSQSWLLQCGHPQLGDAMFDAFVTVPTAEGPERKPRKKKVHDEGDEDTARGEVQLIDDDLESHKGRLGRWIKESIVDNQDVTFHQDTIISLTTREPVTHLQNWLMEKVEDDDTPKVLKFVWYKARELGNIYNQLLYAADYQVPNCWESLMAVVSSDLQCEACLSSVVMHTIEGAADYQRRLISRINEFPLRLFLLVYSRPHVACEYRQAVCEELCNLSVESIHDQTTVKIKIVFRAEIEQARIRGTLCREFFELIMSIARRWDLDTQHIEGAVSTLKILSTRAAFISWPLMSSRITNKKMVLGIPRAEREHFIQACVACHDDTKAYVASSPERWDVIDPDRYPQPVALTKDTPFAPPPKATHLISKCAARFLQTLRAAMRDDCNVTLEASSRYAIKFVVADEDFTGKLTVVKEYVTVIALKFATLFFSMFGSDETVSEDSGLGVFSFDFPLVAADFLYFLEKMHALLLEERGPRRQSVLHAVLLEIRWNRQSTSYASIVDIFPLPVLSDRCRCSNPRLFR
jgi:hypothetical protein